MPHDRHTDLSHVRIYKRQEKSTLNKLTEKECIFVMDVIKALKQHLQ